MKGEMKANSLSIGFETSEESTIKELSDPVGLVSGQGGAAAALHCMKPSSFQRLR